MYLPSQFEETRPVVLQALMRAHPLATLVTLSSTGLSANHIPMTLRTRPDGSHVLAAHVARSNPLWHDFDAKVPALAVFQGPQHYISPNWYPTKQEHGKAVPTWNYVVVHASGPLMVRDDPHWVLEQLTELTQIHEQHRPAPWAVSDAPTDFTGRLIGMLVGIEIPITSLQGKWKVSQNQPGVNREGVVKGLGQEPSAHAPGMAALVAGYPAAI
jgi:transcriptional regulator